jgi:putative SOS response-associated peptidase YedK
MCGRFTLTRNYPGEVATLLGVEEATLETFRPRYNIAPLQRHFVVVSEYERRKIIPARWGLVNRWAKDNSQAARCINAKAETVDVRPAFRDAFQKRRCVVPADGFYEWTGPRSARRPLWFHRADGRLVLFAGLYESWYPAKDEPETTFTIITCAANKFIMPIHDRMPVILPDDEAAEDWMNPREAKPVTLKRLLVPAADSLLVMSEASPLVNSPKNDGPELLALASVR